MQLFLLSVFEILVHLNFRVLKFTKFPLYSKFLRFFFLFKSKIVKYSLIILVLNFFIKGLIIHYNKGILLVKYCRGKLLDDASDHQCFILLLLKHNRSAPWFVTYLKDYLRVTYFM